MLRLRAARWLVALVVVAVMGMGAAEAGGLPVPGALLQQGIDDDLTVPVDVVAMDWTFHPTDSTKVIKLTVVFSAVPSNAQEYNIRLRVLDALAGVLFQQTRRGQSLSEFGTTDVEFNFSPPLAVADVASSEVTICEDVGGTTPADLCGKSLLTSGD